MSGATDFRLALWTPWANHVDVDGVPRQLDGCRASGHSCSRVRCGGEVGGGNFGNEKVSGSEFWCASSSAGRESYNRLGFLEFGMARLAWGGHHG